VLERIKLKDPNPELESAEESKADEGNGLEIPGTMSQGE
jgi:hypothetical protein